jgi:histidinol phosphatase-like PHP family hydrolase
MTWCPIDCHAHTVMSDGLLTVEQLIECASRLGVSPSVSDHISRSIRGLQSVDDVIRYLDVLETHPVLRGGEFCWHDSLWRELPDATMRRFTHRLGSVHAVVLGDGTLVWSGSKPVPTGVTVGAYMDAYLGNIERMAGEMPVDILAHPTILTKALSRRDPEEVWTEVRETRLVDALFSAGIVFEVSARYPPHQRIVRRAVARGVRLSLGSDGHRESEVAAISAPLALTRSLGVRDEDLYDPARHGSRTLV